MQGYVPVSGYPLTAWVLTGPHDQGKGKTCIDDGPLYDSLKP